MLCEQDQAHGWLVSRGAQRATNDHTVTSDAIFRSHTTAYDLFIDLSSSLPLSSDSQTPVLVMPDPDNNASARPISYAFTDLPLYRSLVMLDGSPSSVTVTGTLSRSGGLWLLAFDLAERIWRLCVGVCEYAVGRGRVGSVHLAPGDEDAEPLMGSIEDRDNVEGDIVDIEDEAARRGRLILKLLDHHSYHLSQRLRDVTSPSASLPTTLSPGELKLLTGTLLGAAGDSAETRFWQAVARRWGFLQNQH